MSILFEATKLGNVQVKNRFVHSATYEAMATKAGEVTDDLVKRYQKLARGGVGLIIPGYLYVHPLGKAVEYQAGIHDDDTILGLSKVVDAVHRQGSKIVFQLVHAGRQTSKSLIGQTPMGPSSKGWDLAYMVRPKRMDEGQIHEVIQAFGKAAERAVKAGADGIQVHAAHGYLVNQFLSPFFNVRNDAWGGSDENRFRFLKEIILEIRRVAPQGMPILIKLNTRDYTPRQGMTPLLAARYARWLAELEIDGLEASSGTVAYSIMGVCRGQMPANEFVESFPWWKRHLGKFVLNRMAEKYGFEEGYNLKATKTIRSVVQSVPLFVVGGLRRVSQMEAILQEGHADLISMSRPFIREPFLVKRIEEGKTDAASCVSCNRCYAAVVNGRPVRCDYRPD
jgi:2,4-dienoyl-CoA reductase-like NADH-dependent reductase (Old Yellow Enzyme family)